MGHPGKCTRYPGQSRAEMKMLECSLTFLLRKGQAVGKRAAQGTFAGWLITPCGACIIPSRGLQDIWKRESQ